MGEAAFQGDAREAALQVQPQSSSGALSSFHPRNVDGDHVDAGERLFKIITPFRETR